MSVKKIFVLLIVVVTMVLVGALVLNVLLPNVATTLVNAIENMVFKATGMAFDWNGDGVSGSLNGDLSGDKKDDTGTNDTQAGTVVNGLN